MKSEQSKSEFLSELKTSKWDKRRSIDSAIIHCHHHHHKSSNETKMTEVTLVIDNTTSLVVHKQEDMSEELRQVYQTIGLQPGRFFLFAKFMLGHTCYDVMRTTSMVQIINNKMKIGKAFRCLADSDNREFVIYHKADNKLTGMLKEHDYLRSFTNWSSLSKWKNELNSLKIYQWRKKYLPLSDVGIHWISPESSVFEAIKKLTHNDINTLPVYDDQTGDIVSVISSKDILAFLVKVVHQWHEISTAEQEQDSLPNSDQCSLLGLGKWTVNQMWELLKSESNPSSIRPDIPLYEAMATMVNLNTCALPVISECGELQFIFTKSDALVTVIPENQHLIEKPISEFKTVFNKSKIIKCKSSDYIKDVVIAMARENRHRLIVLGEDNKYLGMVTSVDVLQFLVIKPVTALTDSGEIGV